MLVHFLKTPSVLGVTHVKRFKNRNLFCVLYRNVYFETLCAARSSSRITQQEVVSPGPSVCHNTSQLAVVIEHNTIWARALTSIKNGAISHDGELVVGSSTIEGETLVVVLRVGVAVPSDSLPALLVLAPSLLRIVDGVGVVGVVAAGCATRLAFRRLERMLGQR